MTSRIRRLTDPGTLALACVLVLGIAFVIQPQFDPDYWWHVLVGDRILHGAFPRTDPFTFTAQGHPFIVQEWGSEALFAALMHIGMGAVIVVMAVVAAAGFLLALSRARRYTSSNAMLAVLGVIGLAAGRTVFGPRAQMFTFLFIALLLWLLDRHRRHGGRAVWWLVPMFGLWGNLHGGFSLGLGLFLVVIVADWVSGRVDAGNATPIDRRRTLLVVFGASIAALLVNPNGIGVFSYAGGLLSNIVAQSNLQEWRSPNFHDHDFIPLAVLIVLLIVVAPRARRIDLADTLLAGAGLILTLYAVRNLSTVIVTSMPLLADGLDGWATVIGGRPAKPSQNVRVTRRPAHLALPFCASVLVVVTALTVTLSAGAFTDARNHDRSASYPVAVADTLCTAPPANVFQPYGSAGWLLYEEDRGAPRPCSHDPVFIFGDVYVMGPQLFQDYLDVSGAAPGTAAILDAHRVDAVWQGRGSALATWLAANDGWTCVWGDPADVIYARHPAASHWPSSGAGC